MTFNKKTNITALTATIKFDNFIVGGLQELTVSENWNVKPVHTLGKRFPVANIPGFFGGEVTARKAFIEKDQLKNVLMHYLKPVVSSEQISNISDEEITLNSSKLQNINLDKSISTIEDVFTDLNYLFCSIYFDIVITDETKKEITVIRECILDSKRTSYSQSNIVIMKDVTFKYTSIQKKL